MYGLYTIIKKLVNPLVPIGFSSLMSAIMFIGGMLMLMVGLVGEYIGRMYICMNNAPQYVVREIVGEEMHKPGDGLCNGPGQGPGEKEQEQNGPGRTRPGNN